MRHYRFCTIIKSTLHTTSHPPWRYGLMKSRGVVLCMRLGTTFRLGANKGYTMIRLGGALRLGRFEKSMETSPPERRFSLGEGAALDSTPGGNDTDIVVPLCGVLWMLILPR